MKIAKINNKHIVQEFLRFDPTFHLSDSIQLKEILSVQPYRLSTVGEQSKDIFFGNIFSRIFVQDEKFGVPYMTASDMMKSDINSGKFIAKRQAEKLHNLIIKKDWILISCSGTLGNVIYTNELFENKMGTHDLIRIIPQNGEVKSGFLYAYLASKYGYTLLTQSSFGGVIKHINPEHVANIPVPIFPQEKQEQIHNLITEAAKLRVEANRLLEEAVEVFEKEIGVSSNTIKTFSKKVKDLGFSWAAYNNNVECASIHEKLEGGSLRLGDLSEDIFAPPLFKHIYLSKDNGYPFITGSELTRQNIRFYRWLSPRGVKDINNYVVCKGSLLLYKSGTTDGGILGNVFIADDNLDGVCLSDHIIRIKIDNIKMSYWVYAFLKSAVGVKLLQQLATGTMIPFITPERLKNLPIPMPDDKYEFVTHAIDVSLQKRVKANNNENQAISLVENEIALWQS